MEIEIKYEENGRIVPFMNGSEITMEVSPFLIFLATAGMCSAVFVKAFLSSRGIPFKDVKIIQKMNYNYNSNMVKDIDIQLELPDSFPKKYNSAIKNVVDQCPVKQHLLHPPTFNVNTHFDTQNLKLEEV